MNAVINVLEDHKLKKKKLKKNEFFENSVQCLIK